jgi:hypothetical protein
MAQYPLIKNILTSAMYHVLTILLHRPFVADGHFYNTSRSISVNSFITCASAADSIVAVLRTYDRVFSVRHAPYLISYATYVAATIHVRIAASPRRTETSRGARECLQTCLAVFQENRETNWAVRRAQAIVEGLMMRLGVNVSLGQGGNDNDASLRPGDRIVPPQSSRSTRGRGGQAAPASTAPDYFGGAENLAHSFSQDGAARRTPVGDSGGSPSLGWSDIEGIIQSFVRGQDLNGPAPASAGGQAPHQVDFLQQQQQQQIPPGPELQAPGVGSSSNFVGNQPWLQGGMAGGDNNSTSFEDLLFGFNGSALDSMFS